MPKLDVTDKLAVNPAIDGSDANAADPGKLPFREKG
jgi:hypothetical protein